MSDPSLSHTHQFYTPQRVAEKLAEMNQKISDLHDERRSLRDAAKKLSNKIRSIQAEAYKLVEDNPVVDWDYLRNIQEVC